MVDHAGDGAGPDLTKIVLDTGVARLQHDGADDVVDGGRAGGHATDGAGRVLAVEEARRLGLGDRVGTRAQATEQVAAVSRGGLGNRDGLTQIVRAGQGDRDGRDAGVAGTQAVVVGIEEDHASDAGRQHFTEVVVVAHLARGQHDGADHLVDRGVAAGRACGVLAVELARRLRRLGHRVGARAQVGEAVAAVRVGDGGCRHRLAQVVGARQRHRHAAQPRFRALLDAVVVVVAVDESVDRRIRQFAEVVLDAVGTGSQRDGGDLVVGNRTASGAGRVLAVQEAGRLRFVDLVGARPQVGELVEA